MLNILSVWPRYLWERKQSPSRRFYARAVADREDVNHHLTGPDFDDWDNDASGLANIRRIMPDCHAILSYKAAGGCDHGRINEIADVAQKVLVVEQFNECWPACTDEFGGVLHPGAGSVVEYARQAHLGLLVYHHANDLPRIAAAKETGCRLAHIPHCAHPMFAESDRPWDEREGIVLTGSLNNEHYPLRCRLHRLIHERKLPGVYFRRPPNYTQSVEVSDALVREYAEALGRCRVKLGCASVWKYALQHYSEAALAGCAHVADMPEGVTDPFGWMVAPIDMSMGDAELAAAVELAHDNAEQLGRMAQVSAKNVYTTAHYAERMAAAIREAIQESTP